MKSSKLINGLVYIMLSIVMLLGCATGCKVVIDTPEESNGGRNTANSTDDSTPDQPSQNVNAESATGGPSPNTTGEPSQPPVTTSPDTVATKAINLSFNPGFDKVGNGYIPIEVAPRVADYTISPNLTNVVNVAQFPNLTAGQKQKLAINGFVAAPGKQEQLFYIYEDNTYKKIPSFVTTDSVLQVYHIFYDYALRSAESMTLRPNAIALNNNMLTQLQAEYDAISAPLIKKEALIALGYFGVAQLAFGETLPANYPSEIKALVEREMILVNAAEGRQLSPLFGYEIDYSLFTPRGHYTASKELEKYFIGMSWYSVVPFPLYNNDGSRDTQSVMRSIIIATALSRLPEYDGGAIWENIYSATKFFVGSADDVTPFQFAEIISKVLGNKPDLNELSDPVKLDSFYEEADKLPMPQIIARLTPATGKKVPVGLQFRFMGQRYIPDSEILQQLSEPIVRPFPTGLDIFASLGSKRAADIISSVYKPTETWPEYTEYFERMKAKFTMLPDSAWQSNMYYAWLWTQNSLTGEYGEGYPMFMRNTAWQDKSLSTALGSWAEMRHDTILYAKGSSAECGDGIVPPVVRAYVEPNPELYNRLIWLTAYSRDNLLARGILPERVEYLCDNFIYMLTFLRDCSIKELRGEDLTTEEYDSLLTYGGTLEHLTLSCIENADKWYQIQSETDRNMAVIADVHTAYPGGYLEEAVGTAAEIYVIVPVNGQLYLTRGAMFDYFEFVSQNRMTDKEWQTMIKQNTPERPPFTTSFHAGEAMDVPAPLEPYSTGC